MLIDTHCHINSLSQAQRQVIFDHSRVEPFSFIDVSIDTQSAVESVTLSRKYPNIYSALGFHPFSAENFSTTVLEKYQKIINSCKKIIAIGEIGLDFKADSSFQKQKEVLSYFLRLAKDNNLPVVIHNRWSDFSIFEIIDNYFTDYKKIIFHCFSQNKDFLKKVLDGGGVVSFSLNLLRKQKKIMQSLEYTPIDRLLLETDSPYMRIKNNYSTPLDIKKMYYFVADAKEISLEELKTTVYANAESFFGFKF
jgi:TatD DNase family protein